MLLNLELPTREQAQYQQNTSSQTMSAHLECLAWWEKKSSTYL